MTFELDIADRVAIYDPNKSTMIWKDSNEPVFETSSSNEFFPKKNLHAISPLSPGKKDKELKLIKIQLGFACNYSCTYCNQNNMRKDAQDNITAARDKVELFFEKLPNWFSGGEDNLGRGVKLEFWGGEPLLYWDSIVNLATKIRTRYPHIILSLTTNGSLIKKEMATIAQKIGLHFNISHDGESFENYRAKDPLLSPKQLDEIKKFFNIMSENELVSFNCAIHTQNFSLLKIRNYLASKLEVPREKILLTSDLITPYDEETLKIIATDDNRQKMINNIFEELLSLYPHDLSLGQTSKVLLDFIESLQKIRPAEQVGQKCGMDSPQAIAVDLDGNVLTCQNVTAKSGHKIGHIDEFDKISLNTSHHWSTRKECVKCPVVQICKGSCMYLEDKLWEAACNQHFTWSLAYLSLAIYLQTNLKLNKISSPGIRSSSENIINVLY